MLVKIFLNKTVDQNAAMYFEAAKKARKKREGAIEAVNRAKQQLTKIKVTEKQKIAVKRKLEWFEKFRWFYSSEGILCIGGRDATTNDIVVKKHMDEDDTVFHATIAGSPFFIVKGKPGPATIEEAAQATGAYSRAWKLGFASAKVFHCKPEQVSKTAQSGEYLEKGSFMIYGKTTTVSVKMELAIGVTEQHTLIGGPVDAVKHNSKHFVIIKQGKMKNSDMAKKIKKELKYDDLDEIIKFLPGEGEVIFQK